MNIEEYKNGKNTKVSLSNMTNLKSDQFNENLSTKDNMNLKECRDIDIMAVDPSTLVDLESVKINKNLPREERIKDYLRQIKNPYCFKCHGVVVKIGFAGKKTLEECLERTISI